LGFGSYCYTEVAQHGGTCDAVKDD
jgi:hypothetical protein